jgi:hypothetical protein
MLADEKLVVVNQHGFGRERGRPEILVFLSEEGARLLHEKGVLDSSTQRNRISVEDIRCLDHQLLMNWFRIHLAKMQEVLPRLTVRFPSPTSPFRGQGPEDPWVVHDNAQVSGSDEERSDFMPDGAFSITDSEQKKSVLFFLEVDMGTETLVSQQHAPTDIRQKILNYQAYFRSGNYKLYERILEATFNGFRLLFLANSPSRFRSICHLVQETPPSDFIWVTDEARMFSQGLADRIWARGGRCDDPPESIAGRKMCQPSPMLPVKE